MGTELVAAEGQEIKQFRSELEHFRGELEKVIPQGVPIDAFLRVVLTAVQEKPELVRMDRKSFFRSCTRCAMAGLMPDGLEAAFVPFKNAVTFMPMVRGKVKQFARHGYNVNAHLWYKNDTFDYQLGDNESITHKPSLGERGEPVGVYAIARNPETGAILRHVMTIKEVDAIRAKRRNPDDSFWRNFYEDMVKKTAIHRLAKQVSLDMYDIDEDNEEANTTAIAEVVPSVALPPPSDPTGGDPF